MPAEIFNMCLKESCFPDCWKVLLVVPVFASVGEMYTAKSYRTLTLLSVVTKVLEILLKNRIVHHLEKCGLCSDFEYSFSLRSVVPVFKNNEERSTAQNYRPVSLLSVVSKV